jgi:hypothetical protein
MQIRYPCLSKLRHANSENTGFGLQLQVQQELESRSTLEWSRFSKRLSELTNRLQDGGLYVSDDDQIPSQSATSDQLSMPNWDFKDFISEALVAMACHCRGKAAREMGLRLGTYQSKPPSHLTILARDRTVDTWTEMRLHSELGFG